MPGAFLVQAIVLCGNFWCSLHKCYFWWRATCVLAPGAGNWHSRGCWGRHGHASNSSSNWSSTLLCWSMGLVVADCIHFPPCLGIGFLGIDIGTYYGLGLMAAVVAVVRIQHGLAVVVSGVHIRHCWFSHTLFLG